ncbi:MAG: NUDIX hydrolase, partial [bacterium]
HEHRHAHIHAALPGLSPEAAEALRIALQELRDRLPLDAKRELLEETGYAARRWIALGRWYPSPASTNMKSCYFLALDARRARRAAPEDTEFLRVELHPFRELLARVQRLPDSPVGLHLGILLAGLRLGVLHAGHAIDEMVSMKTRSIPE